MSKEIDQFLKKQLLETPKCLKKYLKDSTEATPGITYYTGNWGQDLEDNLCSMPEGFCDGFGSPGIIPNCGYDVLLSGIMPYFQNSYSHSNYIQTLHTL